MIFGDCFGPFATLVSRFAIRLVGLVVVADDGPDKLLVVGHVYEVHGKVLSIRRRVELLWGDDGESREREFQRMPRLE